MSQTYEAKFEHKQAAHHPISHALRDARAARAALARARQRRHFPRGALR